jgi:hypothetical protein
MTWFRRSAHPEDELSAYADGELGARARRAVETHVAGCEACSKLLRELQDTKSLLSELPKLGLRRAFALGPEFAVERREAPAPRRMSFSFAPAAALSVLVALLVVDAANFPSGGSSEDGAFNSAGSTASSRQAEPEAAGDTQALESTKADEEPETPDSTTSQDVPPPGEPGAASGGAAGGPADADAAGAASAEDGGGEDGTAASALAPPSATSVPEEEPEALTAESAAEDDSEDALLADESVAEDEASAPAAGGPEDTTHLVGTDDSSDGPSTLRILEIVAAIAFAASLVAVFLPRFAGRRER